MYHMHPVANTKIVQLPLYGGAADIAEGALIVPGTTADQDKSVFIAAPGAGSTVPADIVGILNALHDYSEVGDSDPDHATAPALVKGPVHLILPGDEIGIEYNTGVTVSATGASTTTSIVVTNLADQWDGGWMYVVSGTGVGQLAYAESSASGSVGVPTLTTAPDATSTLIGIMPVGSLLLSLSADATKLNTYAANTNYVLKAFVLRNQFTFDGKSGWETLDPTRHLGLNLSGKNPKFRSVVFLRDLAAASID